MTQSTPERLAAGLLGPSSLFKTRRGQKVGSAVTIVAACLDVISEGIRPSIMNVVAKGRGFSESTLNRTRYKPILKASQRRFEALQSGQWQEGEEDDLSAMIKVLDQGYWIEPAMIDTKVSLEDGDRYDPAGNIGSTRDGTAGSDAEWTIHKATREIAELQASNGKLRSELQRRDDQLYHALGLVRQRGQSIAQLRARVRTLQDEVGALSSEPWAPRAPIDPDDDDD